MRGDDDQFTLLVYRQDFFFQDFCRYRIKTCCWFIKNQYIRVEHKGKCSTHLLNRTTRKCTHLFMQDRIELEIIDQLLIKWCLPFPDIFHHIDDLPDGHVIRVSPLLWHVP